MTTTNMCKPSRLLMMAILAVLLIPFTDVRANDYLEQKDHYTVYAKGASVIHFKIPIYSRGGRNYYVSTNSQGTSQFYYKKYSWDSQHTLFTFDAQRYGNNADDDVLYGTVDVKAWSGEGVVEITNIYNGTRVVVPSDGYSHTYNVTKNKEAGNDNDNVTWLEVDWYMPEQLDEQEFEVYGNIQISLAYTGNVNYTKSWDFGQFQGGDAMMSPQLYDPYFYATKEVNTSGYGCAAVPYVLYYDPTSYTTSPHHNVSYPTDKRSDNIFVQTTDTLQPGFMAIFNVYRMKSPSVVMASQSTNAVTIPAYHRIYDLTITEEKDEYETFTGNNVVSWSVKNPQVADLVEGDYFEVQRALRSDFSDAQTIDVVPMERGADKGTYTLVDNSRDSWSGNAAFMRDTLSTEYSHELKNYVLYDTNGNAMCEADITFTATNVSLPAVPVYYRVRRASASMWGWKGHDFAREQKCMKHNFLAPLAETQADYTLDADSRQVDFRIVLENREVASMTINPDSLVFSQITTRGHEMDESHIRYVTITGDGNRIEDMNGTVKAQWYEAGYGYHNVTVTDSLTVGLPAGYELYVLCSKNGIYMQKWIKNDLSDDENLDMRLIIREEYSTKFNVNTLSMYEEKAPFNRDEQQRFDSLKAQLTDSIALVMSNAISGEIGHCMWDRSARLVLIKTMDGVKQELIIPQDSIRRLANGNWEAHFVDLADHACTNYSYAVRIDQSQSDLHVNDSAFLRPVAIHGPNLYFDEGASIKTFTASANDSKGDMKRGIMLRWEPTTAAVDSYVLTRIEQAGDEPDTVYTGVDNSFFDTQVKPQRTYTYTLSAVYDCNGRHTEHQATTTGSRSVYGEIRGRVLMPDNSGMAGVTVTLTNSSDYPTKSYLTGSDGSFVFDSVAYAFCEGCAGTDYVIVPTSRYGTFSFNYTSAASATIHLSEDNCIARDIAFMNTSTMRLSGRALYKGSTIPVAGAMFLLSGDTVRRNGAPLTSGIDGTFELTLTTGQPYTLQIVKPGHRFEGDGMLQVEQGSDTFALTQPLDGVRFYDETKVRLVGRVAGGNIQRDLPEAFGLGTNNLGDDLQLVLQLEGDNTAQFVHDPNDLTLDTVQYLFDHTVYTTDTLSAVPSRTVGSTSMLMAKKRITIRPDQTTGEYQVDLYPVKYKVVQASANGYATLFAAGQGSETFDLTNAPLETYDPKIGQDSVHYNAVYDRIYHTPVQVHLQQLLYGLPQDGYGEASMKVSSFNIRSNEEVALYTKQNDGTVSYTLGYPVFYYNRKYQFEAQAYEDYYYNNDSEAGTLDRVPQRGGSITIHNGMESTTTHFTYVLDSVGKNRNIYLNVSRIETELSGVAALHTVSTALSVEGNTVETEVFRSFVAGDVVLANELRSTDAAITILDIVRDPGGNGSSAWLESGASYTYSFRESYDFNLGVNLTPTWGVSVNTDIGTITGAPGTYTGTSMNTSKEFAFSIPVTHEIAWSKEYTYNFTTTNKVTTSAVKSKQGIGANADVFLGVKTSVLAGKAKCVSVINDTLYQQRQPAIQSGAMHVLAQGIDAAGKPYYLVIGDKIVLGSQIDNTFAYTQHHILHSVLPRIFIERDNLLEYFADSLAAQQAANQRGEEVYWYIDSMTAAQLQQPLLEDTYKMIVPSTGNGVYTNRVGAMENTIKNWIAVLSKNEEEKIKARYSGMQIGVYSVSAGTSYSHSDTYTSTFNYSQKPQAMAFGANSAANAGRFAESWVKNSLSGLMRGGMGKTSDQLIKSATKFLQSLTDADGKTKDGEGVITEIQSSSAGSSFQLVIEPVIDIDLDFREGQEITNHKSCGFTIMPDKQGELTVLDNLGEITVAVYRANVDSVWDTKVSPITDNLTSTVPESDKYGSYVFFTQAGSTYCMFEDKDTTMMYNPGTTLNNPTLMLAKPEMSINTYEQTNVLPDQKATFRLELRNAGEIPYGWYNGGVYFTLSLYNSSNPNGAKVFVNGAAIAQGIEYYLEPGQSIVQTLEVERGDVDDYENLQLCFQVSDCPKNWTFLDFSVHYLPLSCDVQIDMPRQNWVMNTLSQRDSTGYYIPVEISGFDTHYKNFDHIEFQYKLSTESEEMWVNLCSFYAEDSLYERATGNKAMIENGRITPFRFYGGRDPMEQQYDLRAVSFCRYGSGFVTKTSPIISGTKDTRPPRVFGSPQPADAILGVGNDLKLRFNEAIAGNYLDEDNNFQILGMTNATGITTGTSLHFQSTAESKAETQVERSLTDKSFTIDMMVRPAMAMMPGSLFFTTKPSSDYSVQFGYFEGRLVLFLMNEENVYMFLTEANVLPSGVFSRVIAVYNNDTKQVQFYIGTQQLPLSSHGRESLPADFMLRGSAPLTFGGAVDADMLEARIWTKALTPEEIAATNMKYLTGYERDLMAYYRMDEGRGTELTDRANGATLYSTGTSWNYRKGISLAIHENERAVLEGNLLSRSAIQDESILLWFKTAATDGTVFSAGRVENDSISAGTKIALENGVLKLHHDSAAWRIGADYANNEWHHLVLTIDRTRNNVSVFVDGEMRQSFSATDFGGVSGAMYLGGNGFEGNIDDVCFFEQALPKYMMEGFDNLAPAGDEMGLIGYLPFEHQVLNPNGVLELVFSPNDQRIFRDPNGNVVDKVIPLIKDVEGAASAEAMADKVNHAPTRDQGQMTKMKFDWAFNNDELLINLNMEDREINKQTIYVTVRDVEDMNGNPMASPVSWVAFVDRNALKWSQRTLRITSDYDNTDDFYTYIDIINHSGRRHQYTIESLPDWLTVSEPYGTMTALEEKQIRLKFDANLPVGVYNDQIYLTDEDGMAEPLIIEYTVKANPPYDEIDHNKYTQNMSVCAEVRIQTANELVYDSDENDIVYAMYKDECVGMANISFDEVSNKSQLFLTVYGNDKMNRGKIRFQLWQASTGKIYHLDADRDVLFSHHFVYGCDNGQPLLLTTNGRERQTITLQPGWNWTSFNLLPASEGIMNHCMSANDPWRDGDLIKNPDTRQFVGYSVEKDSFTGFMDTISYHYTYMIYCQDGNTMHLSGNNLPADSMAVTVRGNGQWSPLPCLLKQVTPVAEALADYYDNASIGDMIKSHDHFAYFSQNKRWEGDLSVLRPGEGYFLRRMAGLSVTIHFYNQNTLMNRMIQNNQNTPNTPITQSFSNPQAATNMTMIASVDGLNASKSRPLEVFVNDELAAVAEPILIGDETFYFLTIQSDKVGSLRFELNGQPLEPFDISTSRGLVISYEADSHHGSLTSPIVLHPADETRVYKIIENNRVIIIRNNEKYDVTGQMLQ